MTAVLLENTDTAGTITVKYTPPAVDIAQDAGSYRCGLQFHRGWPVLSSDACTAAATDPAVRLHCHLNMRTHCRGEECCAELCDSTCSLS